LQAVCRQDAAEEQQIGLRDPGRVRKRRRVEAQVEEDQHESGGDRRRRQTHRAPPCKDRAAHGERRKRPEGEAVAAHRSDGEKRFVRREEAQDRGQNDQERRDRNEPGAREEANDRRPDEVELFFDRERPDWADADGGRDSERRRQIRAEQQREPKIWERTAIDRQHDGEQEQEDRQDAQCAPAIKLSIVIGTLSRIEQDARDQKAREDEEEIDAEPAVSDRLPQRQLGTVSAGGLRRRRRRQTVVDQNGPDGDGANAVKFGHACLGFGPPCRHSLTLRPLRLHL